MTMILEDVGLQNIIDTITDPDPGFSSIIFLRNLPGRPLISKIQRIDRAGRIILDENGTSEKTGRYTVINTDGMGLILPEMVDRICEISGKIRTTIVFLGNSLSDEKLIAAVRTKLATN